MLFSLANTHKKDAGIGSMTISFSIFIVLHMEVSFEIIFTMPGNEIDSCVHWMLVLHFFQGRQWNGRECLFPLEGLHAW